MNNTIVITFREDENRTICFKLPDGRDIFMDLGKLKRGVVELKYSPFPDGSARSSPYSSQYFKFLADTYV